MRADSLENKLKERPKQEELIKEGILEADENPLVNWTMETQKRETAGFTFMRYDTALWASIKAEGLLWLWVIGNEMYQCRSSGSELPMLSHFGIPILISLSLINGAQSNIDINNMDKFLAISKTRVARNIQLLVSNWDPLTNYITCERLNAFEMFSSARAYLIFDNTTADQSAWSKWATLALARNKIFID